MSSIEHSTSPEYGKQPKPDIEGTASEKGATSATEPDSSQVQELRKAASEFIDLFEPNRSLEEIEFERTGDVQRWLSTDTGPPRPLTEEEKKTLDDLNALEPTGSIADDVLAYHKIVWPQFTSDDPYSTALKVGDASRAFYSLYGERERVDLEIRGEFTSKLAPYFRRRALLNKEPGELKPCDEPYYQESLRRQRETLNRLITYYEDILVSGP